jgi:hypothetical protein
MIHPTEMEVEKIADEQARQDILILAILIAGVEDVMAHQAGIEHRNNSRSYLYRPQLLRAMRVGTHKASGISYSSPK